MLGQSSLISSYSREPTCKTQTHATTQKKGVDGDTQLLDLVQMVILKHRAFQGFAQGQTTRQEQNSDLLFQLLEYIPCTEQF